MAGQDYVPAFLPGHEISCVAGAAITAGQLVYVSGNSWPNPTVSPTSAATAAVCGVAANTVASGAPVDVYFKGVHGLTAAGTITAGDNVVAAASGQVADLGSITPGTTNFANIIGSALNSATATNTVYVLFD